MFIATVVVSVLLSLAFAAAGAGKVAMNKMSQDHSVHLGFSANAYRGIGALELAGAAGLLIGLWVAALGAAAGIGLVLMMVGAVIAHVRAKDAVKDTAPAAVFGLLALAAVLLRLATA